MPKDFFNRALEARGLKPLEKPQPEYRKGVVLAKFKEKYRGMDIDTLLLSNGIYGVHLIKNFKYSEISLLSVPEGQEFTVINRLLKKGVVEYAEPDYMIRVEATTPNDPRFSDQWALDNADDHDIDAPEAWDITTGSSDVVVAVIDTGVDYTHEDLQNNMWTNPGEIPGNGIDDDMNGYVDDVYGIDTYNGDTDPIDDHGHGTHCAGIIGAEGNNGVGIAGINWNVKIMALKFIGSEGYGFTSGAIEAIEYVMMMKNTYGVNVKVTSNSWGSSWYSHALYDAIKSAGDNGILFVAAAGNYGDDSDNWYPIFPAAYDLPNIISVGASDSNDERADFSNYGGLSVDLYAPGVDILSTVPEYIYGDKYKAWSGTSMATPHVAGVAALLLSQPEKANFGPVNLKFNILFTVDDMADYAPSVTLGRLNAYKAVSADPDDTQLMVHVVDLRVEGEGPILRASVGQEVVIGAMVGTVAGPVSTATVTATIGATTIELHDDGLPPDKFAGDGVYTGSFVASEPGYFNVWVHAEAPGYDSVNWNVPLRVKSFNRYSVEEVPYKWIEIRGVGKPLNLGDDGVAAVYPSFDIMFYGVPHRYMIVGSNGAIALDDSPVDIPMGPRTGSEYGSVIMPMWMDLVTYPDVDKNTSNVYVAELGTAPNRVFVVEWNDVPCFSCAWEEDWERYTASFEVVFYENSTDIDFYYKDVVFYKDYYDEGPDYGGLASVGVQFSSFKYGAFTPFSFHEPKLHNGMGLRFSFIPMLYFDMGTDSSPVAEGFVYVTDTTTIGTSWYGWTSALQGSRDRGTPDPLTRDLVFDDDGTFSVKLPDGLYSVFIVMGDPSYPHDKIDVMVEGVLKADDVDIASGEVKTLRLITYVNDGELTITFHDDGGTDANWVVNGIYIVAGAFFDFGTGPLADYRIGAGTDKFDPHKGYGWLSDYTLIQRDRGTPDDLLRDLVAGKYARVFRLNLPNSDSYIIQTIHMDANYAHDFLVNSDVDNPVVINAGEVAYRLFLDYTATPSVSFSDGFGSDIYWIVNAIHIRPSGW